MRICPPVCVTICISFFCLLWLFLQAFFVRKAGEAGGGVIVPVERVDIGHPS